MVEQKAFPAQGLQNLIRNNKGDRSYDRLARDTGAALSGKRLQQLATTPMKNFPDPGTITGLARALRCSNKDVLLACAESLNIAIDSDESGDMVLPGARNLPASSRELLLAMSEEMQELQRSTELVAH